MSSSAPENQEGEDLILSFLNQDCFADTEGILSDPKLLPSEDNLWDFLNNVPNLNKDDLSGGASPPWSSSSSDDNGGTHIPSSPHSVKEDLSEFKTPKREETETDYWQYVNEDCVLETPASNAPNFSGKVPVEIPLSLEMPIPQITEPFTQGVSIPSTGGIPAPLFYPHGLPGIPTYPGLHLFPTIPVMPIVQPVAEPPKKKRGRKKREPCPAPSTANLVPLKPLIPVNAQPSTPLSFAESVPDPVASNDTILIKKESAESTMPIVTASTASPASASPKPKCSPATASTNTNAAPPGEAAAALNKRQERLIKNRAAALLSRKRKREHMANLETANETLQQENDELKARVQELEQEVESIAQERDQAKEESAQLRKMLQELGTLKEEESPNDTSIAIETMDVDLEGNFIDESEGNEIIQLGDKKLSKPKTTGVVLMIIFFSFALFSLPMTNYQSTIGSNYGSRAIMSPSIFTPPNVQDSTPRIIGVESTPKAKQRPSKRSLPNTDDDLKCRLNYTELPLTGSGEDVTRALHTWLSRQDTQKQKVKPAKVENKEPVSMAVATIRDRSRTFFHPSITPTFMQPIFNTSLPNRMTPTVRLSINDLVFPFSRLWAVYSRHLGLLVLLIVNT
ncbi:hypothetical protein K493DRAFT_312913 [Basidiobolus meristosporus CBS 931.73]|uniref:BZIP domain-containing protein n=1 Tax=Basidiobolus meristosporus CBS 931.73 TaxID=1314790 RepID=A0A1Y1YQ93_9FUNG|nr:hypothetical protein K493DRAFT_312913 [Basidiobolus meristosporus CBS 931.73]|eukprot:ORY00211.1 hypothetical protein K493DRAFT_312913 [Basidiobolus meristosporus CBS 931.73]